MVPKCTGTATFSIDVRLPDMVFATVRMNPAKGAAVVNFDATAAKAMRGVLKVLALPGGVAVIANNTWRAFQAAQSIQCDWAEPNYPGSTAAMMDVHQNIDGHQGAMTANCVMTATLKRHSPMARWYWRPNIASPFRRTRRWSR